MAPWLIVAGICTAGCGYATSAVRLNPSWFGCDMPSTEQSARYVATLDSVATGHASLAARVEHLRELLPGTTTFPGYYRAICGEVIQQRISTLVYENLVDSVVPEAVSDQLGPSTVTRAPSLTQPAAGARLDIYPRVTTVQWRRVHAADYYLAEVEILLPYPRHFAFMIEGGPPFALTDNTTFTFEFEGAQMGRWRVRGIDGDGRPGPVSAWRTFRYLR